MMHVNREFTFLLELSYKPSHALMQLVLFTHKIRESRDIQVCAPQRHTAVYACMLWLPYYIILSCRYRHEPGLKHWITSDTY